MAGDTATTATSEALHPICKERFAPAQAPLLSLTPAALQEGASRVWTQSLQRNAQMNAMLQAMAESGDGAVAFPEQIAFCRALSSAFLALATLCAQGSAHKEVCKIEIITYVRDRGRWGIAVLSPFRCFLATLRP